jgi:hypothetical protein
MNYARVTFVTLEEGLIGVWQIVTYLRSALFLNFTERRMVDCY